jgi:MFS family permease
LSGTGAALGADAARRRRTLRACCGAHLLHDGLVDMLYALLPALAEAFGLSYAQVGLVRAANRTATASLQIPAGILGERVGARRLLLAGTALAGLAYLGLAATDGFALVLVCFFLVGCGTAVQHPLASALITDAFDRAGRRAALGTYNAFGDVGKFAFLGAAVLALGAGLPWQAPVAFFGVVALTTAGFVGLALPAAASTPAGAGGGPGGLFDWGVRDGRGALSLGAIAALDSATRNGFLTFVAFVMIDKGVATQWAALAVLVTVFGGMLGKLACGLLAERIGVVRTIAATEIGTALGIVAVVAAPSTFAFALLPFLGIFLNGTSSVVYGTVGELVSEGRHARAYGFVYTLGSVSGIVAPLGYGLLGDAVGVGPALIVVALVVLVTLPLLAPLSAALARSTSPA